MTNPIQMINNLIKGGKNPQEIAMQMVEESTNPVMKNLVDMAQKGDYQGVESFARNMFKEQGRDFDTEMNNLKSLVGNFK